MKFIVLVLCLLALTAWGLEEKDGILELTSLNFEEGLSKGKFVFVKFFAPWCGHCKELAPKYIELAKKFKESNNPTIFAEVDASEQKDLKEKYKIESYPTLYLFKDQKPYLYNGGLAPEEISGWLLKKTTDTVSLISNSQELENLKKQHDAFIVYFGKNAQAPQLKIFQEAAFQLEDYQFARVQDPELFTSMGAKDNQVILFRNFDEPQVTFSEDFQKEKIVNFVQKFAQPAIIEFDDKAIDKIFQKNIPAIFLFKNFNSESEGAATEFKKAASQMKNSNILFCMIDPNNKAGHFNRLAEYVGVNTADLPKIIILKSEGGLHKYILNTPPIQKNIIGFIDQFLADPSKLEKFLKTQAIPEVNDKPVRVIVGKSFEDEVINNQKDVLVKFYAPWCGHCKQLAPLYEEAAKKMQNNKNIVIAEMDSTANETPRVQITGFPTLKFWPGNAKDKEPVTYDGPRTAQGIIDWLKQHATQPWVEIEKQDL